MPKVLISDALSPRAADILTARGIAVDFLPGLPAQELKARIGGYEGLAVRSATKVTSGLIERAAELKVIGRAGIGVDNIDVGAATQRGIVVMNTPYGNSITAAEHTIAMLFVYAFARKYVPIISPWPSLWTSPSHGTNGHVTTSHPRPAHAA